MPRSILLPLAVLVLGSVSAGADVRVSNLFSDNVVLQREIPCPVWGVADLVEEVAVKIGDAQATAKADAKGRWMAKLPAMKANAVPHGRVVSGSRPRLYFGRSSCPG